MRHWIHFIAAMISVIPFTGVVAQNDSVRGVVTDRAREYVQGSGEADSIPPVVYDRVSRLYFMEAIMLWRSLYSKT